MRPKKLFFLFTLYQEKLKDTNGVFRNQKSQDTKYNGQKRKDKRTNNKRQNSTQKTKERAIYIVDNNDNTTG
jgi:hypothetical protein